MFQRDEKPGKLKQVGNFFWPSIGFRRSTRYLGYRLARLPGTPYSLAAGFAFGAAISFTPFVGFHFLFAGLLAWAFRANILASAFGTAVGNPWTFPFIWTGIYNLGYWMIGAENMAGHSFTAGTLDQFLHDLWEKGWQSVSDIFLSVIFPMLIGSIPVFLVVWVIFFYPLRALIRKFHVKRAEALLAGRTRREASDNLDNTQTRDSQGE